MRPAWFALVATFGIGLVSHTGAAQDPRSRVILPGFRGTVVLDTTGVLRTYPATHGRLLAAAEQAIRELGPTVQVDAARGLVGNLLIKTQRRFADSPMSQLVDCGVRDRGPNADFYRIHMAIMGMTRQRPDSTTELRVAFAAGAQGFSGPLADTIPCSSTGKLEARVHDRVAALLKVL